MNAKRSRTRDRKTIVSTLAIGGKGIKERWVWAVLETVIDHGHYI